jgi:hypothetical protein
MAQSRSVTMNGGPFDGETKEVSVSQNLTAWYGQYSGQRAIYKPDANGQFQYVESVTYEEHLKRLALDVLSDREEVDRASSEF